MTDANDGEPVAGRDDHRHARRPDDHDRRRRQLLAPAPARRVHARRPRATNYVDRDPSSDRRRRGRLDARLQPRRGGRRRRPDRGQRHGRLRRDRRPSTSPCRTPAPAPLTWEAKERDQGATAPDLPPAPTAIRQARRVGPPAGRRPASRRPSSSDTTPGPGATPALSTIITDPAGDSLDSNDVTTVRAGSDGSTVASMAIDFAPTHADGPGRRLRLPRHRPGSVDRRPGRGLLRQADPGHRHGVLRRPVPREQRRRRARSSTPRPFEIVAEVEATRRGPHDQLRHPARGARRRRRVHQHRDGRRPPARPSDWAPDEGHGTIEPFSDAPWLSETPESGTIAPGGSQVVDDPPRRRDAAARRVPRARRVRHERPQADAGPGRRDVDRDAADRSSGRSTGTVTDAHSERAARRRGRGRSTRRGRARRSTLTATTADDGTYSIVGPAGTWPTDYSLDGYVPLTTEHHDRQGRHDLRRRRRAPQATSRTPSWTAARSRSSSRRAAPRA